MLFPAACLGFTFSGRDVVVPQGQQPSSVHFGRRDSPAEELSGGVDLAGIAFWQKSGLFLDLHN